MTKCIQCNAPSNITFRGTDYCWTHYDDVSGKTANSNIGSNNDTYAIYSRDGTDPRHASECICMDCRPELYRKRTVSPGYDFIGLNNYINANYFIDQDKLYCEKYLNNLNELIYDFRYDDKEQTFYCMLIKPIEYITLDFIVTPTGIIYKEDEIF